MTLHQRVACILGGSLLLLAAGGVAILAWALRPLLDLAAATGADAATVDGLSRELLWRAALSLAALALLLAVLALAVLRTWSRSLRQALGDLLSLARDGRDGSAGTGEQVQPASSTAGPEFEQLAQAVSSTVHNLHADLGRRAVQLAELQRQYRDDPLTGLPLRAAFLAHLQAELGQAQAGRRAILLLRVPRLEALNLRLGREATDRLLCAIGHLLLTYVDRVHGAYAGRLNGSDFALYLPAAGVALETAQSLRHALGAVAALRSAAVSAAVGGVDGLPAIGSSAALAEADAALARAEAGEGEGLVVDRHADLVVAAAGASAWRTQIGSALELGRLQLQEQRVVDRHGRTVHLRCAPQLRLGLDDAFQPARLCLALARRSGLLAALECAVLRRSLQASAADGRARCVHVGAPSLETQGFVTDVATALRAMPAQAAQLSIVMPWPQKHSPGATQALAVAAAAWRLAGARIGIESTAADTQALAMLPGAGVGFVTVDAQPLRGIADDAAAAAHASDLFASIRSLGLAVLAEGELSGADLATAWTLGLDGACEPLGDVNAAMSAPAVFQDTSV